MKANAAFVAIGFVFCSLGGCGSSNPDAVFKARIRCWEDATDVFASIKDEKSALSARTRLDDILAKIEELNRKPVGKASDAALDDARSKNMDEVRKATERLNAEMDRAAKVPGGAEVIYEFNYRVRQTLN